METRKRSFLTVAVLTAIIFLAVAQPGTAQLRRAGDQVGTECAGGVPAIFDEIEIVPLTAADEADIIFLREEEKLARDVYLTLAERWQLPIFRNIARAEQRHMDLVLLLIEAYEIEDPVVDNTIGVFTDLGLAQLYAELVALGEGSVIDALVVGTTIEDMDLADLYELLEDTDNRHLALVAYNLAKGSRNHLRAFFRALTAQDGVYTCQYLDPLTCDDIVASETEQRTMYDADGYPIPGCEGEPGGRGMRRGRHGERPGPGDGEQPAGGGPHGDGQRGGNGPGSGECDGTGSSDGGNGPGSGECDGTGSTGGNGNGNAGGN